MKKSIKLFSVILSAIFCFTMAITIMVSNSFKANAEENKAVGSFVMKDGFEIRVVEPLGLRVMTSIDATDKENLVNDGAQFGTLMLPERLIGEDGKLTIEDSLVLDIKTSVWNEDGNSYNSVLFAGYGENQTFPDKFFNDPIVARSYYVLDGEYYYSNAVTRSMSYVAAAALADGKELPVLTKTEQAIPATLAVNDGQELAIDGEYSAIFTVGGIVANSDKVAFSGNNSAVVSVDETTGKITAVGAGTATITATLGDVTASCEVTVAKNLVEGTQNYVFGHQQGDLVLNADAYDGDIVKVTMNDTEIATGSTVPATNFTTGEYKINVETANTIYTENVKAVTAIIKTADDFVAMHTYNDDPSAANPKGTFILANDIDLTGTTWAAKNWSTLNFDGQGYTIANAKGSAWQGLFGKQIFGGTIKNVAVVGFEISSNFTSGFVSDLNGGTIENVYVQGKMSAVVAQSAMLVHKFAAGNIRNVVVDYDPSSASGSGNAIAMIAKINEYDANGDTVANLDGAIPSGIKNVYSIGCASKHIVTDTDGSGNTTYQLLNKATGGYDNDTQFFANAQFSSDAFTVGEDANGTRVLKFFGKTVKHTVGYMNTDLIIDASELGAKDGDTVTVNYAGADLTGISVASGKITVPKTNFSAVGKGQLVITVGENTYYRQLNVVTALIASVDEFKAMSDYATLDGTYYSGTFLQVKDIDFKGETYSNGKVWKGLNYDAQGYSISNVITSGLFASTFRDGLIKNVIVYDLDLASNWSGGLVNTLYSDDDESGKIENVFARAKIAAAKSRAGFIAHDMYTGATLKNVIVDWNGSDAGTWQQAGTIMISGTTAAAHSIPSGLQSVYNIGNTSKHICYFNGGAGAYLTLDAAKNSAFADDSAFLAAKASVFTGDFAKAFKLVEGDTTTLTFYGRTVKTFA